MRITDAKTFVVANPPPGHGGRCFVFVKLTTKDGIAGVGEAYAAAFGPENVARLIEEVCARHVVDREIDSIETLWRRVWGRGYSMRGDVTLAAVLSAIETALWDILGKEADRPVHALLGGKVRERLRAYTYLYPPQGRGEEFYRDPEATAEQAAAYAAQGFSAVKFDPMDAWGVFDPRQPSLEELDRAARMTRLVREAVGSRADILIGTHGQFTAAGAIRLARRLEPFDPLWLEEPTPPEAPEEMARVARATSIPVAAGERLCGRHEFARLMEAGAAAILQMNAGRAGGVWEARKIAAMAETRHLQIAPHLYNGPVAAAANIHLAASSPNFLILEGIGRFDGFHAEILKRPLRWEEGFVIVPDAPGLGVELNEEVAAAHPWRGGDRLHLEPREDP